MGTLGTIILTTHLVFATAFSLKFLLALPYVYPRRLRNRVALGKYDAEMLSQSLAGRLFSMGFAWCTITVLGLFGAYLTMLKGKGYRRFFFAYTRKEMDNLVEKLS